MGRRYRRVTACATPVPVALIALALVTACGGGTVGGGGSCADAVRRHGEDFFGSVAGRLRGPLPALAGRVEAVRPPCDDTNATPGAPTPVRLRRLAGVPASIALVEAAGRRAEVVYLGEGFFAALASHPLHRAFYGSARRPVATRGLSCRGAAAGTGRAQTVDPRGAITVGGRTWTVDARTRFDVPDVGGTPHLRRGARIRVVGMRCAGAPAIWVARRVGAA
jgi:hypothetical protein